MVAGFVVGSELDWNWRENGVRKKKKKKVETEEKVVE
jgi:hypothetical protein